MAGCNGQRLGWATGAGLGIAVMLAGCGKQGDPAGPDAAATPAPATLAAAGNPADSADDPRWHLPFGEATITDPPPPDQQLAARTFAGKSVGKLFLEVTRVWNEIRFVSPSGKRLQYRATLDTELGTIDIALRPDLAPNHVRNFIALARVGYYDGLVFERTMHAVSDVQPNARLDLIQAGCPLGTGAPGFGSIGYWLPLEVQDRVGHEPGTVGAVRDEHPDTAACKFYITLSPAPVLDGEFTIFGKVTRGLDVASRILTQPVRNDAEFPQGDRPVNPIVIRKVTIHVQEAETLAEK
jgi:peptidyl-prolyl cis-trans isomerase B (cyclophilin B)